MFFLFKGYENEEKAKNDFHRVELGVFIYDVSLGPLQNFETKV